MQQRTLTVLFTDIVGSTKLFGSLDQTAAERLRCEHFALLDEAISRHRGRRVKTLGDGVMASFACAEDAIMAALAVQRTSAMAVRRGRELAIRAAVSSGDVTVEDGDCFGTAVVEASRLCAAASGGQILLAESTRLLARSYEPLVAVDSIALKGLDQPTVAWEAPWQHTVARPVRVVLADDSVLVREGVTRLLEARGFEVVAQARDPEELMSLLTEVRPDVAIVDVRMPPTHTDEGVRAAEQILREYPSTGVLIFSQDIERHYVSRLLAARRTGVGYLLKERVSDVRAFVEAALEVAAGGTAFEPAQPVNAEEAAA